VRRRKWFPILFLAAAVAVGCSNSTMDLKFSDHGQDNNWKSVFKTAVTGKKLSQEDTSLLQAAVLREMQHIPPTIAGKTVREVIKDQKEWLKANSKK
jgi:hypothetical protein